MKGKRVTAGILFAGILAVTLAGCKNIDNTREETKKAGHYTWQRQLPTIQLSE